MIKGFLEKDNIIVYSISPFGDGPFVGNSYFEERNLKDW